MSRRAFRSPAAGFASSSPTILDLFTDGNLTAAAYRCWLDDRGVSYVAVSDAEPDYLSRDEEALIAEACHFCARSGGTRIGIFIASRNDRPGLRRLATRPARGDAAPTDRAWPGDFTLSRHESGELLVRLHYTPYWTVTSGSACVERDGDWTGVEVSGPGTVRSPPDSAFRPLRPGRECSG